MSSALRAAVIALVSTGVLPAIERIGYVATDAIAAVLAWIGFLFVMIYSTIFDTTLMFHSMIFLTVRYGAQMRAWVDVGYSTAENN